MWSKLEKMEFDFEKAAKGRQKIEVGIVPLNNGSLKRNRKRSNQTFVISLAFITLLVSNASLPNFGFSKEIFSLLSATARESVIR